MSDPSDMVVAEGRGSGGKFAKGHKFGGGLSAINALSKKLRWKLIKKASKGGDVDKLYDQLMKDAVNGPGPVRVAAARTLLSYILGKPDQTLNVKDARPARPAYSVEQQAAILERLGVPEDRWPVMAKEYRRKQIEARVSDAPATGDDGH
jgi:hypothetical protein